MLTLLSGLLVPCRGSAGVVCGERGQRHQPAQGWTVGAGGDGAQSGCVAQPRPQLSSWPLHWSVLRGWLRVVGLVGLRNWKGCGIIFVHDSSGLLNRAPPMQANLA